MASISENAPFECGDDVVHFTAHHVEWIVDIERDGDHWTACTVWWTPGIKHIRVCDAAELELYESFAERKLEGVRSPRVFLASTRSMR